VAMLGKAGPMPVPGNGVVQAAGWLWGKMLLKNLANLLKHFSLHSPWLMWYW